MATGGILATVEIGLKSPLTAFRKPPDAHRSYHRSFSKSFSESFWHRPPGFSPGFYSGVSTPPFLISAAWARCPLTVYGESVSAASHPPFALFRARVRGVAATVYVPSCRFHGLPPVPSAMFSTMFSTMFSRRLSTRLSTRLTASAKRQHP